MEKTSREILESAGFTVCEAEPPVLRLDTPAALAECVSRRMEALGLSCADVASGAGLSAAAVRQVADCGKGSPREMRAVAQALRLRPVTLPSPR